MYCVVYCVIVCVCVCKRERERELDVERKDQKAREDSGFQSTPSIALARSLHYALRSGSCSLGYVVLPEREKRGDFFFFFF